MKQTKIAQPKVIRPFYLRNEDNPKLEPVPEYSKWIALIIAVGFVTLITYFLSSCATRNPVDDTHIATAADGP